MISTSSKLTERALARLLELLDPDAERAAVAYEKLRERTAGLLRWWGAVRPEELADETLDRVAHKLDEGAVVAPASLGGYVRGIARLVFYESRRERIDQLGSDDDFAAPPREDDSAALRCLDHCLASLDNHERHLVLRYYDGNKIEARQRIAKELAITMTALRIRMHRLRARLERCVSMCVAGASERFPASATSSTGLMC